MHDTSLHSLMLDITSRLIVAYGRDYAKQNASGKKIFLRRCISYHVGKLCIVEKLITVLITEVSGVFGHNRCEPLLKEKRVSLIIKLSEPVAQTA